MGNNDKITISNLPPQIPQPEQWQEWQKIDREALRLAMTKSKDYSPSNILGIGDVGIMFILISKLARLANLFGIELDIKFRGIKTPEQPNHESINDNLIDMRNYAQIAVIYRRDKWGK